jgi:hypothetical protein
MKILNNSGRISRRMAAVAATTGSTALLVGVLVTPAAAVTLPPYNTTVTVTSSAATVTSGQPVTFTAKVAAIGHGTPGGQVSFTITGSNASTVTCDGGSNDVALAGGLASCVVTGGLLVAGGPYAVAVTYTDTLDSNYKPGAATRSQVVKQGKTTTTLTSTVNPAATNEPVNIVAAVAPIAPAGGTPSGSVTFTGVTCDGGSNSIAVAGGLAQCSISAGLAATITPYSISATYSGDTEFLTSTGILRQTVKPAATTVTLVPTPNNCNGSVCTVGQGVPVSFTATAATTGTDGGAGLPAGNMVFAITAPGSSKTLTCDGGTNTIAMVSGQATCSFASGLTASIYFKVTATLSSTQYAPSTGTIYENSALASTTTSTSVPKNIGTGQTFSVTAVVAPTAGYSGQSIPTGFVNFLVCGNNSNGYNGCQGGASPVAADGTSSFMVGGGEYIGAYSYSAVYVGDTNFYSSTARAKYFSVSKSTTMITLSETGGFTSFDGQAVAITATVSVPNGAAGSTLIGPPSGTVTFTITGPNGPITCADGNTVSLPIDPGQVEGSVACFLPPGTLTNSTPPATAYSIQASYSGDSSYVASNGRANQIVVPVVY